ncbi:related to Trimethyllysine dioxygenase [Cephalotrichum gorgonifer]|uniref:trimethyllysine dioxygenase n=1 Tax=Cephalotrichum gorgonifer TaxID=2041049 RepID=A0AAE8MSP0_9PEZI|nr:related to Trimethyllysine dioxygenase [Cephalotrichum gorgonifer]
MSLAWRATRLANRSRLCGHSIQTLRRNSTVPLRRRALITDAGIEVTPESSSQVKRTTLPSLWLRDNCRCTSCINQDTRQRNFNTFDLPKHIKPAEVNAGPDGLEVKWSGDGHRSHYPWDFISFYQENNRRADEDVSYRYWGAEIDENPPTVGYSEVMDASEGEKGVADLTRLIREYGFAFVSDCPHDDAGATEKLLERIAFIRITHYGGFYDFIPDLALADTAYTNLALPAHTDNTYFTDPAGLQSFHLMSHHAPHSSTGSGAAELGGKSLLVDGFHAANILRAEDPRAFDILTKVKLPWHASGNKGITIAPDKKYPVIELDEETGNVHRIRWNNDDRGVVPFTDGISPTEWYEAARTWYSILTRPEVECWTQLRPGRPLIFDNWRVLHGRSAFEGVRRICGGYINRDDFISRWRNTNFPREEILSRVVG